MSIKLWVHWVNFTNPPYLSFFYDDDTITQLTIKTQNVSNVDSSYFRVIFLCPCLQGWEINVWTWPYGLTITSIHGLQSSLSQLSQIEHDFQEWWHILARKKQHYFSASNWMKANVIVTLTWYRNLKISALSLAHCLNQSRSWFVALEFIPQF